MSELELNNIRAVGLQWQIDLAAIYPPADTSSPPILEESWLSLNSYISYYLQRGWRL